MKETVIIIGGGYSGLVAACRSAQLGYNVKLIEKNNHLGGRCNQFTEKGYTFDMGPSWYWFPQVFENIFKLLGEEKLPYKLKKVEPSYKLFLKNTEINIFDHSLKKLMKKNEPGCKYEDFIKNAKKKYDLAMEYFINLPNLSISEYFNKLTFSNIFNLNLIKSHKSLIKKFFENKLNQKLMEWPVLFLGGSANMIPGLYSLIVYSAIYEGTWYPLNNGLYDPIVALEKIALKYKVDIHLNTVVQKFNINNNRISDVILSTGEIIKSDHVISTCDYQHMELQLPVKYRMYTQSFWNNLQYSPSCLLYYIGLDIKLPNLELHNLFFDTDYENHISELYKDYCSPKQPLFYVNCTSKISNTAPINGETLMILVPISAGLKNNEINEVYIFNNIINRIYDKTGINIKKHIIVKKIFMPNDFNTEYNSFKNNAYGLANTALQTGFLRPRMRSIYLHNLIFAGQTTCPGPGVPPSMISGIIATNLINKNYYPSLLEYITFHTQKILHFISRTFF